jgi:RimJ/RimL family protein N-acetyltransferase
MIDGKSYEAKETLRNGQPIRVRAIRPEDKTLLLEVLDEVGNDSLYLRFFQNKTYLTDQELKFFTEVDFIDHVALVATAYAVDKAHIIGGGRYIVCEHAAKIRSAELAFMVLDRYQGQGMATLIMKHLLTLARDNEIAQFEADVLSENARMLAVFSHIGLPMSVSRAGNVLHVTLVL